jgi:hypothetical protein
MAKKKTLEELAEMRAAGIRISSEAEIAAKRAARAEKKAQQMAQKEVKEFFPFSKKTTDTLWKLRHDIREFRKDAVAKGIKKVNLPEEWKQTIYLAFEKLDQNEYRDVFWSLITECLKVQDREIKCLAYDTADRWLSEGRVDFGWLLSLLGRNYVSRYGWALLRKHADKLAPIGSLILKDNFNYWAEDPETWKKWNRLAEEDGLPADIRVLYAQYARK